MIKVGIIGLGFMGGVHLRNWQALDGAEVVAVCDANPISGVATLGNIDAGAATLNLDGVAIYTDVADMLTVENLDTVSITLPTHLHKMISIQCLEAGVHVLCEKPMALNVADCDAMIAAASKAKKQLMVAHCIRFWPAYVWAKKAVESGEYGKVLAADFSRLTYAPVWADDSWLSDPSKSGGIALDLHNHDLDFIQYLFGAPKGIRSICSGTRHVQTWVDYGDDRVVSATASWLMPESFGFEMSYKIIFEKAAIVFDGTELKIYPDEGEPLSPELGEGDGYAGEIEYFAGMVSGTNNGSEMTPEQARESVRMTLETIK
jgi:predicted dehydrogenase